MTEVTIYWQFQPALKAALANNVTTAEVRLEPNNAYDADARAVFMGGFKVGCLRKTDKAAWPPGPYPATIEQVRTDFRGRPELACILKSA